MSNKETNATDWRSTASKRRTRGIIGNELVALFEVHDDIPIAQHLVGIMRSKGKTIGTNADGTPKYRDFYSIKDEEFLKDLEAYKEDIQKIKTEEDD